MRWMRAGGAGAVVVGLVLAGCGSGSDQGAAPSTTVDEAPAGTPDLGGPCTPGAIVAAFSVSADEDGGDVVALDPDGTLRALSDDGWSYGPAVSPDGTEVAFVSPGEGGMLPDSAGPLELHLFVVPAEGGEARELPISGLVSAPAWSPDGRWLAVEREPDADSGELSEIWVVDAAGEEPGRSLVAPDGERDDRAPTWSPDGRRLAFVRDRRGSAPSELMVAEIAAGLGDGEPAQPEVLVASDRGLDAPAWSVDGEELAVESVGDGGASLAIVDAEDGEQQATLPGAAGASWTADGRVLAYGRAPGTSDATGLWRVAEFVPDDDGGFATGLPVPGVDPVYDLYSGFRVSAAPCEVGEAPLTAGVEPVPMVTVTVPSTGEELTVLARETIVESGQDVQRLDGAPRAKLVEPDSLLGPSIESTQPGEPPSQLPLLPDGPGPLVWVVCGEESCVVLDPTTAQGLVGGAAPLAQFDELVDVAPA